MAFNNLKEYPAGVLLTSEVVWVQNGHNGILVEPMVSTPANPPSGSIKLYFKSDGSLYSLNSVGTETEIGSSGGDANIALSNLLNTDINTDLRFKVGGATTYYLGTKDATASNTGADNMYLIAGNGLGSGGGGTWTMRAGDGGATGNGAGILIQGGTGVGAGCYGGNVELVPGKGVSAIYDGVAYIMNPRSNMLAIFNTSLLASTNKTFYFPNKTGTLALNPMTQAGDIIYGGASGVETRLGIGGANTVLHGGVSVPAYSAVIEADITLAANTTNDVVVGKHGFAPSLPGGTTLFWRGDGAFAAPASVAVPNGYVQEAFAYTATVEHNIVHNFGAYPVVQAFDATATPAMEIPQIIRNIDTNTIGITFSTSATRTLVLTLGSPPFSTITATSAANYAVQASDYLIKETGSGKIVTLPTAVGRSGKIFIVKNSSAGICDVLFTGGQNADGYTDVTIPAGDAYSFMSDGSNYLIF